MNKVWAIAKRDFQSYFASPVAYIVLTVYMVLSGFFFYSIISYFARNESMNMPYNVEIRALINNMAVMLLFVTPMLTMKLFAEEKKMGTLELLLTSPVTLTHIVLGKFLAASLLLGTMIGVSLQYPAFLISFGNPDPGPLFSAYLGFTLLGLSFIAVGVFASSLTENQIISTMISFGFLLIFWMIGWVADGLTGMAGRIVSSLSLLSHLESFTKGMLDLTDITFYVSVIVFFLFMTVRRLEWGRW